MRYFWFFGIFLFAHASVAAEITCDIEIEDQRKKETIQLQKTFFSSEAGPQEAGKFEFPGEISYCLLAWIDNDYGVQLACEFGDDRILVASDKSTMHDNTAMNNLLISTKDFTYDIHTSCVAN